MATVKCKYCGKQFDREKEPYVQIPYGTKSFRYGHGQCYIDAVNSKKERNQYEVWDPKVSSNCFWCHKALFPNQPDAIPMPQLKGRYVHKTCAETHPANDQEELTVYLIKLFKLKDDFILPRYMKQLSSYEREHNFTYSGMLKALKYWYEVKHNPIDTDRGVGIIPYIYSQAREYYYALYLADQQNQQIKDYKAFIPKDIQVTINPPERDIQKRKLFTFLDEQEELNGEVC